MLMLVVMMIVTCVSDTLAVHDCPEVGHTAHRHVFAQHVEGSDTTCRQPHTHSSVRQHGEYRARLKELAKGETEY